MATTDKSTLPSTPRLEYVAAAPDVALIRNLLGGTRRMHALFKEYIPKWKAEKPENFKKRATSAKVYGGLGRSLSASVGMLFAKEPETSDTWTPEFEEHWANIDGKGANGDVFAKRRSEDAIADGFVGILVDHPAVPEGTTVTAANEKELNLRPFWKQYARADILSWETAVVDNVETVVQVVLREGIAKKKGRFTIEPKLQYRVLILDRIPSPTPGQSPERRARWELLEETKGASGEITVTKIAAGEFRDRDGNPFPDIPLAVGYAGRTDDLFCAQPPLLDLAWCNLEHWRIANNLRYYEDLCAFPQPVLKGQLATDENGVKVEFQAGPGVLVNVEEGGEFGYAELTGSSLEQLRASLQEKRDEMGELGASFLAKKPAGVETAEAKRIDSVAENATLSTAADGIEDLLDQALMFHARYLGIPAEQAPTIKLNRDFEGLLIDAATMTAYVNACQSAGLPVRILLQAFQLGGRIPADADIEALELEMMANAAAAQAERDRLAAEAKAAAGRGTPALAA